MPSSITLAICAITFSVPVILWCLFLGRDKSRQTVRENLLRGFAEPAELAAQGRGWSLAATARRFTLPRAVARLDRLHALAGRPPAWPMDRVITAKPVLAVVALLLGLLLYSGRPGAPLMLLVIAVTVTAYFVPDLLLQSRGPERQTLIGLELPDTLDQMMIAVEAGLGFDSAMARAGDKGKGPLADELVRTLQDMQIGRSRREAYEALGQRTNVPDLDAFIRSVIQADIYGISISKVLRTQAGEIRLKRRQRAEEKAMQIPVKVIIPLMLCILPVLFIALLGPAVLNVMSQFG
ncbi:type II secretion system F family protein [Arthrobacter sp. UYCo732]|uniref:type II secretion system F family protein n=1 Tax=Arthrobacter sp. UYCo732 TaxID=3156336 RepID=UPI003395F7BE